MVHSNTRRRISLQALLHAATFTRRMEKIYKKMDPLQPSPSEEALLQKLHSSSSKHRKAEQTSKKQEEKTSTGWKRVKEKRVATKMGPNAEYCFMKSFVRLFSTTNSQPKCAL